MKKLFVLMIAALTLSAAVSEAYITPGNPPPGRGGPGYGPGYGPGRRPGRPGPVRPGPGRPPGPVRPSPEPYPGNPYPGNPGYGSISVPVYVNQYLMNQSIDIGQYINLYQYQGYRLVAIDFTANAQYNTALLDVLINGFQVAPTVNLNTYPNNFRIFGNNAYIGQGADSIVLSARGSVYISNVFLQLSR